MSLSEIVSRCGLTAFPIAALAIFVPVSLSLTVRALRPSRSEELRRAALLPLEDALTSNAGKEGGRA